MKWMTSILAWLAWWFLYVLLFMSCGAVAGGLLFLTIGGLTHGEIAWTARVAEGLATGAKYFGIWSGGMGIVLCFIKGYRRAQEQGGRDVKPSSQQSEQVL